MSNPNNSRTETIRAVTRDHRQVRLESIEYFVTAGPDAGQGGVLELPVVRIGSAPDNDVILRDRSVSRHHAELRLMPDGMLLRDLGSTNGTFVGQLRVSEVYLAPETLCLLGHTRLTLRQRTETRQFTVPDDHQLGELVGASALMRELYGYIRTVAATPVTILIHGESGCGKELVARTLHALSGRRGPLVVFDASVTDPEMVRNDLFGHVKGAFTGASGSREGAFRQADGGTLFIDEIGELPLDLQPRLLRALENREVTPIGSDRPERVDVRVIAATHRDLAAMVRDGGFRADLYYRLSVVPLRVPSLRAIRDDIPLLAQTFIQRLGLTCRLSGAALQALQEYSWPGNARELRNVIERAAVLSRDGLIQPADLLLPAAAAEEPLGQPGGDAQVPHSRDELKALERQSIINALSRTGNNKTAAARELGIPLSTLKRRLKDYELD